MTIFHEKRPPNPTIAIGSSGLFLCFRICSFECIYARLNLGIDPGVDVSKILVDVVFDVIAKLSKHNVFSLIKSDELSILIETSLFLKSLNIGLKHAFNRIPFCTKLIRD